MCRHVRGWAQLIMAERQLILACVHAPCQILLGLNHMHTKKILHRDIKTLNVFLDDELNVKLGDMGVAKVWLLRVLADVAVASAPPLKQPQAADLP